MKRLMAFFCMLFVAASLMAAQVRLAWDAPTNNVDGTVLTNLAGYKLLYGTNQGVYTVVLDVGNVTNYLVMNLTNNVTYFFVGRAYAIETNLSFRSVDTSTTNYVPVVVNLTTNIFLGYETNIVQVECGDPNMTNCYEEQIIELTQTINVTNSSGNPVYVTNMVPVVSNSYITVTNSYTTTNESFNSLELSWTVPYHTKDYFVDNVGSNGWTNYCGVTEMVGTWFGNETNVGYYYTNSINDGATNKGLKSATFKPTLTAGVYEVSCWYPAIANAATNVPYDVVYSNGMKTILVNQRINGARWNVLCTNNFNNGTNGYVRIRTTNTVGLVTADAVRFRCLSSVPGRPRGFRVKSFTP